jgi:hypothetical protein
MRVTHRAFLLDLAGGPVFRTAFDQAGSAGSSGEMDRKLKIGTQPPIAM